MNAEFRINEMLYRAVYPPEIMHMYWKENGEISSAVFKDKKGLSVERAGANFKRCTGWDEIKKEIEDNAPRG